MAPCHAMICHQVTLSGDAEWPKVADAVIEAEFSANEVKLLLVANICRKKTPLVFRGAWSSSRVFHGYE